MTKRCSTCAGFGFYHDPQCMIDTCAHGPRTVTEEEVLSPRELASGKVPQKTIRQAPRVMDCPPRPCPCPAGNQLRWILKNRAAAQAEAFALTEGHR